VTTLIATSVVRGSRQGDSHGGVYLVDLDAERVTQTIDWNNADIDWARRGWDRGLRGIAFGEGEVFIAASNELFVFDPAFGRIASYRCPNLRHCHEIARHGSMLYLTSTGHDAVLAFDLAARAFTWGVRLVVDGAQVAALPFDPMDSHAEPASNAFHLNSVSAGPDGTIYVSGLHLPMMLALQDGRLTPICSLPAGAHNAQPYRDGVLFNDTRADMVRFVTPSRQRTFSVPRYPDTELTHTDMDDTRIARQAFGRGLCVVGEGVVAAGSSPSTIAVHDLDANRTRLIVTLSHDIRNAIHGLAVWPFG
jgi:hypothetical protein